MQLERRQLPFRLSVLLAVLCALFLLIGGAADAGQASLPPLEYVVGAGDTLWTVAGSHSGAGEDVRSLISDIRRTTGLESSLIYPGQILLIPQD